MPYLAWAVPVGSPARFVGAAGDPDMALRVARLYANGEAVSVNRGDVPPPSMRASEIWGGVGAKLTPEENVHRNNAQRGVDLAYARWARKEKLKRSDTCHD